MSKMFRENQIDLEGYINFLGEHELDATDLMDSQCYPWQYKDKKLEFPQITRWLERAGLEIAAIACGNNFARFNENERLENIDKVKNAIHEAAELGAPLVRIFGGYHEECGGELGLSYANGFEYILQGIEACLPEAEKHNIVLALENHGRLPGLSHEIKSIITHFSSPYVKCMFDCANFLASNMNETEDPLRAYELLKNDIVHCHVKDFGKPFGAMAERRVAAYPAGAGGLVPLRQFAALLERDGFDGYCSLEYEAAWQVPERKGVIQSLEYLKQIRALLEVLKGA
jgi:sugar phosphate isomerase/epimerase